MHKLKEKAEKICEAKDKLLRWTCEELEHGKEAVNTEEMGKVIDMIKDLSKVEKDCWEAAYYMCMVEELKEEKEEMERMGYDNWRYSSGRFAPKGHGRRMGYMMPAEGMAMEDPFDRMGYAGGNQGSNSGSSGSSGSRGGSSGGSSGSGRGGSSSGRSGYSPNFGMEFDQYREAKRHYSETGDRSAKMAMDSHAQEHVEEATETIKEIWGDASPELRKKMKQDFTKLLGEMSD